MGSPGLSKPEVCEGREPLTGLTGFEPEPDGRLASLGAATGRVRTPCPFARRVRPRRTGVAGLSTPQVSRRSPRPRGDRAKREIEVGAAGFEPPELARFARSFRASNPTCVFTAHCRRRKTAVAGLNRAGRARFAAHDSRIRIPTCRFAPCGRCTGVTGFEPAIERLGTSRPVH